MEKDPKIKIFVTHFNKPEFIYEDDIFVPIQAWKKNAKIDLWIQWDNTWDNISEKNPQYAELTTQYWVRKNYDLSGVDYLWFCHYRRYFWYWVTPKFIDYLLPAREGVNLAHIVWYLYNCFMGGNLQLKRNFSKTIIDNSWKILKKQILECDIATTIQSVTLNNNRWVKVLSIQNKTIYDLFMKFFKQNYYDYFVCYNDIVCKCNRFNFCNMYIMKTMIFSNYCEWLFWVLFSFEKFIKAFDMIDLYSAYHDNRFYWMLSEWLFNIYLIKNKWNFNIQNNVNELFFC